MSKTNPPYPEAFRAEAVALVRRSGRSIPVLARDLGVSERALRDWVKGAAIEAGEGPPGALARAEREELTRLRRQVGVREQERAIRKQAAACFAKETR
jgi:transposase